MPKAKISDQSTNVHTGTRIRERRLAMGMKQADLARGVEISPAYLNLIEHNRRRIGGKLLVDLARVLGVDPAGLTQAADAVFLEGLQDAAGRAGERGPNQGHEVEVELAEDLIGRFPGWAELILRQREQIEAQGRRIEALNDRLAHDPFLSSSLHEVLSTVTSIRSTAGILNAGDEIDPEWQVRFHRNMYEDSQRLAEGAQALVQYLDTVGQADDAEHAPLDALEAWVSASAATEESETPRSLSSPAVQEAAKRWDKRAKQDAMQMPAQKVLQVLDEHGPDPSALAVMTGASMSGAMRRLATFAKTEPMMAEQSDELALPEFGLLSCDGSGALTFRKPLDGFAPPRLGGACPLWPLYQAMLRPGLPLRRVMSQSGPAPRSYLSYAYAEKVSQQGFEGPEVIEATMMFIALDEVTQRWPTLLQGSQMEPLGLGTSCRVCMKQGCAARREPSLMAQKPTGVGSD